MERKHACFHIPIDKNDIPIGKVDGIEDLHLRKPCRKDLLTSSACSGSSMATWVLPSAIEGVGVLAFTAAGLREQSRSNYPYHIVAISK